MAIMLGMLLCVAPPPSRGQTARPAPEGVTELFALTIRMNRTETGLILPVMRREGRWLIDRDDLARLPVLPPEGWAALPTTVALDQEGGFETDFDPAEQRLDLTVPSSWLAHQVTRMGDPAAASPAATPGGPAGVVVNYDVGYTRTLDNSPGGIGGSRLAALTEIRWFDRGTGVLSHTQLNQVSHGGAAGPGGQTHGVRLETHWQSFHPDRLLRWQIGDGVSEGGAGMRPLRFGGLKIGSDFDLQPYRTTSALPTWFGSVALPSTVDVYIDGMRRYHSQVPPGAVTLDGVPGITGSGQATVVITDVLGRVQTIDFPFYSTNRLLQQGLASWSVSAGVARLDYGLASNHYDDRLLVNGRYRLGMTPTATGELSFEATEGTRTLGLLAVIAPARLGVFTPRVTGSDSSGPDGRTEGGSQLGLGYEWSNRSFAFNADYSRATAGFRDAASRFGSYWARLTRRAGIGWNLGSAGAVGLSWVHQAEHAGHEGRYLSANWYRSFDRVWGVQLTVSQSLSADNEVVAVLGLSRILGQRRSVSVGHSAGRDREATTVAVAQAMTADDRESWRVQAGIGNGDPAVQGDYAREWTAVRGQAQLYAQGERVNGWVGAQGAVAWIGGHRLAARALPDAFGLVSTEGIADVPVRLENRLIGRTDGEGLLVTPLYGWLSNRISIDALDLPGDLAVATVQQQVVGRGKAGSLIRFPMRRVRAATVVLVDASGRPLDTGLEVARAAIASPAGTAGSAGTAGTGGTAIPPATATRDPGLAAGPTVLTGYDGEVWLDDLADTDNRLTVTLGDGRHCEVAFDFPSTLASPARIGPLTCRAAVAPERT